MSEAWGAFQIWVATNSDFVSAISAAVAAAAAVVFGVYQVRIGRFTQQAALAAEAATNAAMKLEQPILRIFEPNLVSTEQPVPPKVSFAAGQIYGLPTKHMVLLSIKMGNFGRTPCEIQYIDCAYSVSSEVPTTLSYTRAEEAAVPRFILVNEEIEESPLFRINLSDEEISLINADRSKLWFAVSAAYVDYMQQEHIARACWRWDTVAGPNDYGAVREPKLSR